VSTKKTSENRKTTGTKTGKSGSSKTETAKTGNKFDLKKILSAIAIVVILGVLLVTFIKNNGKLPTDPTESATETVAFSEHGTDESLTDGTEAETDKETIETSSDETTGDPTGEATEISSSERTEEATESSTEKPTVKPTDEPTKPGLTVEKDGEYSDKEHVALYIHTYGCLPPNYISKEDAEDLGWVSSKGNLWKVAPGKSIGGSYFGNYEGLLPKKSGRKYYECDIDFDGGYRNAKRIIYSNDGLIFYTEDHYETFEQLY